MSLTVTEKSSEEDKISITRPEETDCDDSSEEEADNITSLKNDISNSETSIEVLKEYVRKRLSTVSEESNSTLTVSEEKGSLV